MLFCFCLGDVMVSLSDLQFIWCRFDSQLLYCQVLTLGKMFTHVCLCHLAV